MVKTIKGGTTLKGGNAKGGGKGTSRTSKIIKNK